MSATGLLLGYDARADWSAFQDTWDEDRRERFLLRQDVREVLSVDSDVWPSAFDLVPDLRRPDWTGYVQDMWDDLGALSKAVQSMSASEQEKSRFIAVELVGAECSEHELIEWRERVGDVAPPEFDSMPHELAGYDVADSFLLSGLTNCEVRSRPDPSRWASLLNDHHLFDHPEPAREFKAAIDELVPEHAPFFVFALWLIDIEDRARFP